MKIINIVGARPNFMKVAPLHSAFSTARNIESLVVHTGQHYDEKMSDIFFNQLKLPVPHYFLGVGGGSHTHQTANIMLKFEKIIHDEKPDVVLVVGDVNSTLACSLVAIKNDIPLVHVEAGLRSGDNKMPEELNRILTDSVSNDLFVTEHSGLVNLAKEGVNDERVHFVGNVMIDSLVRFRNEASKNKILKNLKIDEKSYALVTMHRPANVDTKDSLLKILEILKNTSKKLKIIFPIHPRTKNNFEKYALKTELENIENLVILPPQGYFEFLHLMDNAKVIITDSGGIQEETTYLQVPCLTFRDSTERPVTCELGTNILIKELDPNIVDSHLNQILEGRIKPSTVPPLWDGKTAYRIMEILQSKYGK